MFRLFSHLSLVTLLLLSASVNGAGRFHPQEVPPVQIGDVIYSFPHSQGQTRSGPAFRGGGVVEARSIHSSKLRWRLQVYQTDHTITSLLPDSRDVYITEGWAERTRRGVVVLRIRNENNEVYEIDLRTKLSHLVKDDGDLR